jgi:hypothetical protein
VLGELYATPNHVAVAALFAKATTLTPLEKQLAVVHVVGYRALPPPRHLI